eukprot:m.847356 g.847356  ORF g.847356 m.847356 type:complete len:427 (+) comp23484_c0_seq1:277-1557(+)
MCVPSRTMLQLRCRWILTEAAILVLLFGSVHAHEECDLRQRLSSQYAIATSVFGGVSLIICLCVGGIIFAYKKDKVSLRERIILGLMVVNFMYSIANLIPSQYYTSDCKLLLSHEKDVWIRGVWIWAKYAMVFYEIMIVKSSVLALQSGQVTLKWTTEVACHVACFLLGAIPFVVWCAKLVPQAHLLDLINAQKDHCEGLSHGNETVTFQCLNTTAIHSELQHVSGSEYDDLLTLLMRLWLVPFGVSLAIWIQSRVLYHQLLTHWNSLFREASDRWDRDHHMGRVEVQMRLFQLRRAAYDEIAGPLEPYVVVFVLFVVPSIVMVTDYCLNVASSGGLCAVPCEMVLALRSAAMGMVYFVSAEHRQQLYNVRELRQRITRRLCEACRPGCCLSSQLQAPGTKSVQFSNDLEVVLLQDAKPGCREEKA